jgi:tetratricopeptide (TPR) repeat protein
MSLDAPWRWLAPPITALLLFATPVAAQTADASTDAEAHSLFEAGRTAFAAGRFADALGYFQHAYDLSHRTALLYNVGQCHDRLRHDHEALAAFEQFLAANPDSVQRQEVEARVVILREAMSHEAPTPTPTPTPEATPTPTPEPTAATVPPPTPAPAPAHGNDPGPGPWILLGVGGAVAVLGVVMLALGFDAIARVQNVSIGTNFSAVHSAYDNAPIFTGVGWVSLGLGVAMAAGGLGWGIAGSSGGTEAHAELHVVPGGLSLTGAF